MRLWTALRNRWRRTTRPADMERELDEELGYALAELAARHRARGLTPEAAERAARIELGRVDVIREDVRALGLGHRLDLARRDVAYAWRSLARTPLFSAIVVAVLAGGIGAATAIFSVVDALLLEPLPYRDANRLVFVWQDLTRAGYPRAPLSGPELKDLRDRSTRFTGFGGIWANTAALTDGTEPEQLRVGLVTPDFFDVLGASPLLGRAFQPGDDAPNVEPGIVLSGDLWRRRYGGDPSLVGRRIPVNGRPTTVFGVMPESFRLLLPMDSAIPDDQQAWLLLGRNSLNGPRQQQFLRVVGRLHAGVSLADGQAEVAAIGERIGRAFTEYGSGGVTFYAVGLQADATREMRPALLGLFAAVGLLMTIACVNVAGLMVTRAAARHHETAVRLALGASRWRIFRQCLAEGLLRSLAGGGLGFVVARGMIAVLLWARPPALSRIDATSPDLDVLGFTVLVSVLWGVLFSLAPLSQVVRTPVTRLLQAGGRTMLGGGTARLRAGLVVAQIAISTVLLVSAALLARGFIELQRADMGFDDGGVLTFKVSLGGSRYRGPAAVSTFSKHLRDRLAAIPGVTGVGAISHLPFDTVPNWGTPYLPEPSRGDEQAGLADARAVTPGYFEAIGARLVEGRWFAESDQAGGQPVAIVDHRLAARLWPGESALGRQVRADPGTTGTPRVVVTVIGVVPHLRHREITRDLREQMYFPAAQSFRNPMAYAVKASNVDVLPDIRRAMAAIDPALPIYDVRPLDVYAGAARALRGFTLLLAIAFAVSAVVLAGVGVYGVTAYAVSQRRREFGLRFALGARTGQVARLVLRDATRLALGGTLIGCLGAAWAARLLRTQLYAVSPGDPASFLLGASVVLVIAVVASWLPAARAARTSPLESISQG